jgi:hypothetical protein
MDTATQQKIKESREERGFSVEGFSRREFVIMLLICQEVLLDDDLLESVNPLSKFKGHELELSALSEKINGFLDID